LNITVITTFYLHFNDSQNWSCLVLVLNQNAIFRGSILLLTAKSVFKPHLPPPTPPLNTNVKLKWLSKNYSDFNSKILLNHQNRFWIFNKFAGIIRILSIIALYYKWCNVHFFILKTIPIQITISFHYNFIN
jgi:hypothetical protein